MTKVDKSITILYVNNNGEIVMPILRNVRCQWASVQQPNTKFEHAWEIEAVLEPAHIPELTALGIAGKIKTNDGKKTLRFKQKCKGSKKDGSTYDKPKPRIVDAAKKDFTGLIGNGSLVNINFALRPWTMAGQSGTACDLVGVQVVELVAYAGDAPTDDFDVVGASTPVANDIGDDDCPF